LNDTVRAYNEFTGEGNGFTFRNYNAHDMLYTLRRAAGFYRDPKRWSQIAANAFAGDYSWSASAARYADIYRTIKAND
ncbi:MAG: starch synthase, partial [Paenibacillus macerans]|nr:starch synthase [Paenibacillus macerans]